jgi:hypothetical protein
MDVKKLATVRRFKSAPLSLKQAAKDTPLSIDAENGIIHNVIMCQVGEAKGHGVHLEQSFIDALVAYDNQNFSNGLKARFDHPALCEGTMGTQLGKFTNFRVVEDKAVADLQLLAAADASPKHPQMREWTLKMAQESPDFLMSSIVFSIKDLYQYNADGEKVILTRDEEGYLENYDEKAGNIYISMDKHFYTDIVEAGAATDSLFSEQFNSDKFGIRAVEFFEDNSDVLDFLKESPEKVAEFLTKLGVTLPTTNIDASAEALAEAQASINALEIEIDSYKSGDVELRSQLSRATQRIADLEAEVAELRELPAGTLAGGEKGPDDEIVMNEELSEFGSGIKAFAKARRY